MVIMFKGRGSTQSSFYYYASVFTEPFLWTVKFTNASQFVSLHLGGTGWLDWLVSTSRSVRK